MSAAAKGAHSGSLRRRRRAAYAVVAAAVAASCGILSGLTAGVSSAVASAAYSMWPVDSVPHTTADSDTSATHLGVKFVVGADGSINALKFYKSAQNTGPHTGHLWTSGGRQLAQVTFSEETASGWQSARLATPVAVTAGASYIASYDAPHGRYADDISSLGGGKAVRNGSLTAVAGLYSYSSTLPNLTWQNSNYYVDVVFSQQVAAALTTTPRSTTISMIPATSSSSKPTKATPTTTPGTVTSTSKASTTPTGVTLRQPDGGSGYYGKFTNGLPTTSSFFPVAVWFESVLDASDVATDKAAGLNAYAELTSNSDVSVLSGQGMYALPSWSASGPAVAGRLTTDEVDMWAGPGSAGWTGNYPGEGDICTPTGSRCGYTIMSALTKPIAAGVMKYTNYGKGVSFWESDTEAARFVNTYQDVVSVDNYWFTDPNICGRSEGGALLGDGSATLPDSTCRLAANYGATTQRVRDLMPASSRKPVWNFVEVGHPFSESYAPTITGPQIRAAVWSGLIHGARGTVYFNHNFGGSCLSQHVLRDSCGAAVRPAVTAVNAQVKRLAPVLNAPFVDGAASVTGKVDVSVKAYNSQLYIFAGSAQAASQTSTISLKCGAGTSVSVIDENRSIPMINGEFTDAFSDGNAVHLYKVEGGSTCGL